MARGRKRTPRWKPDPKRALGGRWVFEFLGRSYYNGSIPEKDRRAAQEWAEAVQAEADRERRLMSQPTVALAADWYLLDGARRGLKPKTLAGYDEMLRWFCAFDPDGSGPIGSRAIEAVGPGELRAMLRSWEREGKAAHSRARLVRVVRQCWEWAADDRPDRSDATGGRLARQLVGSNVMKDVKAPKTPATAIDRAAELDDVARFLKWARADVERNRPKGTRGRCMACMAARRPGPCRRDHSITTRGLRDVLVLLRLATAAGCRPGELCNARWEDWEPDRWRDPATGAVWGLLRVEHKTQGHTGRKRDVLVPPALRRAIERIRGRARRHPDYLFTHRRAKGSEARGADSAEAGEPWTTGALGRRIRSWRDRAVASGVAIPSGFSAYWMRHGFYSRSAPRVGAEAAGLAGGTSGAVVRRVYMKGRDADLVAAIAAARRRDPGSGHSPGSGQKVE